jgi:hypothetical protein
MKRLKISMFAVIAIVMGIAASAFTTSKMTSPDKGQLTTTWFQFMGTDPTDVSQVQDNTNYSYGTGLPCSGSNRICAVFTDGVASADEQPEEFSDQLKSELENVILHGSSYSDISKRP